MDSKFTVIILAAGKGTRMKSDLPKVLHKLNDKPMVEYVLHVVEELGFVNKVIITGDGHHLVEAVIGNRGTCVLQKEQMGTGHAVLQAWNCFAGLNLDVLILYGDTPLLTADIIDGFIKDYREASADISVLTTVLENPSHYGRIIREGDKITAIVEYKDASDEQRKINEINTGTCCFRSEVLEKYLPLLKPANEQKELYLTDVIGMAVKDGLNVRAFLTSDWQSTMGINTREELEFTEKVLLNRNKIN